MISLQGAIDLFYYTRNTNLFEFARDIWDIENIYDEPKHRIDYISGKFEDFKIYSLGQFDNSRIQRIIDATMKKYGN